MQALVQCCDNHLLHELHNIILYTWSDSLLYSIERIYSTGDVITDYKVANMRVNAKYITACAKYNLANEILHKL